MNLEEISARIELRALVDNYAAALDSGDAELLESLFVPEGRLAIGRDGAKPVSEFSGAADIPRVLERHVEIVGKQHLMANHRCQIDGGSATGEVYALCGHLVPASDGSYKNVQLAIVYDDEYARTDEGWKFVSRRLRQLWREVRPVDRESYGINAE